MKLLKLMSILAKKTISLSLYKSFYIIGVILLASSFLGHGIGAQNPNSTLIGYIELFGAPDEPLNGIWVTADGAESTTNTNGRYELKFSPSYRKAGDDVQLTIHKKGWVAVDESRLKQIIRSKKTDYADTIVLCKNEDECSEAIFEMYSILRRYSEKQKAEEQEFLEHTIDSLIKIEEGLQVKMNELKLKISELKIESEFVKSEKFLLRQNNEALAIAISKLSDDEVSDLFIEARSLFLQDNIDSAIAILDINTLSQFLNEATNTEDIIKKKKAINNFTLRAQLLVSLGKYIEADKTYSLALEKGSDQYDLIVQAAQIKYWNGQPMEDIIKLYSKAMRHCKSERDSVYIHGLLMEANLYFDLNKSIYHVNEAIRIYSNLRIENFDNYNPFYGFSILYKTELQSLIKANPDRESLEKANQIFEELSRKNNLEYFPYVAYTKLLKLSFDVLEGNSGENKINAKEAINMFTKLSEEKEGYNLHLSKAYLLYSLASRGNPERNIYLDSCAYYLKKVRLPQFKGFTVSDLNVDKLKLPEISSTFNNPELFLWNYLNIFQALRFIGADLKIFRYGLDDNLLEISESYYKVNSNIYSSFYLASLSELAILELVKPYTLLGHWTEYDKVFEMSEKARTMSDDLIKKSPNNTLLLNLNSVTYLNDATICFNYYIDNKSSDNRSSKRKQGIKHAKKSIRASKEILKNKNWRSDLMKINLKFARKTRRALRIVALIPFI